MSQSVKEFVRQSGVEVQSPNSNSNDNFARELEEAMNVETNAQREAQRRRESLARASSFFRTPGRPTRPVQIPQRLQENLINNQKYNALGDEFADVMPIPNAKREIEISKLNMGMFNATVNKNFGSGDRVDLKKILMRSPIDQTPIGEGLYVDTEDIRGVYGQFKTGFSHTKEYGPKGDLNKNFSTVQIKLKITNNTETKGATVNIYKNGKIRFSGGFVGRDISNQAELIRNFVIGKYTEGQSFLYNPFEYNNLSGTFMFNGIFKDMKNVARLQNKFEISYISYEPELAPFLYMTFREHKFILSKSGNIQISGAKNPRDMMDAYNAGSDLVKILYRNGFINITGAFPKKAQKTSTKVTVVKPKSKPTGPRIRKQVVVFMIGAKRCTSLKKPKLVDMAKKMGIVDITKSTTKEELCKKIEKASAKNKKNATFRNTNKNRNVRLSGTNKSFKIGKTKCGNYTKTELTRVAKILNIPVDSKETKDSLCSKIEKARNELAKPKPKPKPKPMSKSPNNNFAANLERSMVKAEIMRKRGLNDNSIRKDLAKLYGDKWMKRYNPSLNQDVRNIKKEMNSISKVNKKGVPFKKDVDALKKNMVSMWKMQRKRELEKKFYMNTANVTGIANNLKSSYRRAVGNYAMNQKNPPTKKKLDDYRKYWLKFRANMNVNNARKKWNAVATAARGRTSFPAGTRVEKV
jgi:TATA-box binding protein (TBP) (component of TFIID and TFIIIB)